MSERLRALFSGLLRGAPGADATILRFGAVGLLTTLIDFALFTTIVTTTEVPAAAVNVATYSTGVFVSFLLNRRWTFAASSADGAVWTQALRFIASNLVGVVLSTLIVFGLFSYFAEPIAKLISVPIVFVWNYAAARFWAFRSSHGA